MTLAEYNRIATEANRMEREGYRLLRESRELIRRARDDAGIDEHNREPGFACFTHKDVVGYYSTEALEALAKNKEVK
jgi:hypothetical protein